MHYYHILKVAAFLLWAVNSIWISQTELKDIKFWYMLRVTFAPAGFLKEVPFVSSSIHVSENDENAHKNSASRVVNISDTSLVTFKQNLFHVEIYDLWNQKWNDLRKYAEMQHI